MFALSPEAEFVFGNRIPHKGGLKFFRLSVSQSGRSQFHHGDCENTSPRLLWIVRHILLSFYAAQSSFMQFRPFLHYCASRKLHLCHLLNAPVFDEKQLYQSASVGLASRRKTTTMITTICDMICKGFSTTVSVTLIRSRDRHSSGVSLFAWLPRKWCFLRGFNLLIFHKRWRLNFITIVCLHIWKPRLFGHLPAFLP